MFEKNHTITIESDGLMTIADAYYRGIGIHRDYRKALTYYMKAASDDNPFAYTKIGMCYELGQGVSKDIPMAMSYYEKACDQNDILAHIRLGDIFWRGVEGIVEKDKLTAAEIYQEALGSLSKHAYVHYTPDVLLRIGDCLLLGIGVQKNLKDAYAFYSRAVEGFRYRLETGDISCEPDLDQAERKQAHCLKALHK